MCTKITLNVLLIRKDRLHLHFKIEPTKVTSVALHTGILQFSVQQLQSAFLCDFSLPGKFFSILNCQNGLRILEILYEKKQVKPVV